MPGPGMNWSVPRGFIVLVSVAGAVVAIAGLRGVSDLAAPIFLALVLTVTAAPLRGWLCRRGVPGWAATLLTLLLVYLVLLAFAAALALSVARLATLLPQYSQQFTDLVDNVRGWLDSLGVGGQQVGSTVSDVDLSKLVGYLDDILSGVLGLLSNLFLIVTLLLFMGMDAAGFPRRLAAIAGERGDVVTALAGFARGTRRYLLVSTIFGAIVAVIDTAALAAFDVPLPVLWGLLAFITNYIPNIGFVIGLVPPALLALLDGGVGKMLAVIATYSVINVIIQSVIQPKVVGDAVGLSVSLTFISLIFWTFVIGPLGALLAIPLSLLVKALLLDVDPSTRWVSTLIGSGDLPPPAAAPSTAAEAPERSGRHRDPDTDPERGAVPEPGPA